MTPYLSASCYLTPSVYSRKRTQFSYQVSRHIISANIILYSKNIFIISSTKLSLFGPEMGYFCDNALMPRALPTFGTIAFKHSIRHLSDTLVILVLSTETPAENCSFTICWKLRSDFHFLQGPTLVITIVDMFSLLVS